MHLISDKGKSLQVIKQLGRGGEGTAYLVANGGGPSSHTVAKIYHHALNSAQVSKLQVMTRICHESLLAHGAWPVSLLYKKGDAKPCGFEMPFAQGDEMHEFYGPSSRKQKWPQVSWEHLIFVARNLACAFDAYHSRNVVIGDVNEKNVLLRNDFRITLVDCDSYQVTEGSNLFPCRVGVPLFTPPELQGLNLSQIRRTPNHDLFGLAVMIFQLLFMGRHPYAGVNRSAQFLAIENGDAIKAGLYAYGRNAQALGISQPPNTLPVTAAISEVQSLFERAFTKDGWQRPTAKDWADALEVMRHRLVTCRAEKSHRYSNHLSECPWCNFVKHKGVHFFICVSLTGYVELGGIDASAFRSAINQLVKESFTIPDLQSFAAGFQPKATPLPKGIKGPTGDFFWGMVVAVGSFILGFANGIFFFGIFWGLSLIGKGWRKPAYKQERQVRQSKVQQANSKVTGLHRELTSLIDLYNRQYQKMKDELEQTYKSYIGLPQERDSRIRQLEQNKRQAQLEAFLESFIITKYRIRGIGTAREKMLVSYGIETAADITRANVTAIPGFGDYLYSELQNWRMEQERCFVFDPRKPVPPQAIDTLNKELLSKKTALQEKQRSLLRGIIDLTNSTKLRRSNLLAQLEAYSRELKQVRVDASLIS